MASAERLVELPPARFVRGDCDGDGAVSAAVADALAVLAYNFLDGAAPPCLAACDADGDGAVAGSVTDAVFVLRFAFLGGPAPPGPFPACGPSQRPADAGLGCTRPPPGC
jgi:hypothetical protein